MSHLHIPDGIILIWLWVLGYVIVGIYFFIMYKHFKTTANYRKITLVSVLGALMLLTMSIPIPIALPYHLNLSALSGILVGPFYAGLAIFCVNLILALVGHGGITIVGLNTVILASEAVIAFVLFRLLWKVFKNIFSAAFIATFTALVFSTFLTVAVVYAGTQGFAYMTNKHHGGCTNCSIRHDLAGHYDKIETFDIKRFIMLILITGIPGWTLESFLSAFIISYINRVKPDILENKGT